MLSKQDAVAEAHLKRQGFEVFIPRTRETVSHARRKLVRNAPLFPGYGFVRLNPERDRWRSINGTIGVLSLLIGDALPIPVPEGIVEELIRCSDPEGIVDLTRGFEVGETVKIKFGPFSGITGTLAALNAKGRVEVLLKFLGTEVRVKAERRLLEAKR